MKKAISPRCPPFERSGVSAPALQRPWLLISNVSILSPLFSIFSDDTSAQITCSTSTDVPLLPLLARMGSWVFAICLLFFFQALLALAFSELL